MKTDAKTEVKIRPYWHVDAKWICGMFFFFFFGLALLFAGLYQATNEKNGIDTMTKMITLAFSRDGMDSAKDIDELKAKIDASPTKTAKPNPALSITLSADDIKGKTPREIRLMIFKQVATPIYFDGKGAEDVLNTPEARANFENDTYLMRLFSEKSHKNIGFALIVLSLISAVLLGLVIFFSARFGRLANPGFIIIMNTWFWALFFTFLTAFSKNFSDSAISFGGENGYGSMIGPFVREIVPGVAQIFARVYFYAVVIGIFLLISAGVGKLLFRNKAQLVEHKKSDK
jgi:hypothetical protein